MRPDGIDLTQLSTKTLQGLECIPPQKFQELRERANHWDKDIRWLSLECIGSHLRMSDSDKKRMKTQFEITPEEDLNLGLKFQVNFQKEKEKSKVVGVVPESAKIFEDWEAVEEVPVGGSQFLGDEDSVGINVSNLKYLAEKLSTIFNVMEEANLEFGSKNRLLSLRDFLKLCRNKIPRNLDFTNPASAVKIFHKCFDLFVAYLYDQSSRK
ncbi:unnamed protein product [Allacma fusca]|uniref:Uncharacterized protein n=1 Tax=Allacma fusca TaxID=39272 RepID=A0A8J2JUD4_9HEXA|nr:unnamed protein product [Allacma fusca]